MAVKPICLVIHLLLCLTLVMTQRPSYAGSRPPNGNKDKYRPTQSPQDIELANRFGEETLANGATQRPPQGVAVVTAEQAYIPISNNQGQSSGVAAISNNINQVTSTQRPAVASSNGGQTSTAFATATGPVNPNRLPLDAHGDQQLIDHLNQIPIDNRPFWFINYQAIEAQRNASISNFGPIASRGSFLGK